MRKLLVNLPSLKLAGVQERTSNQEIGQIVHKVIESYFVLSEDIKNKKNPGVMFSVYTDYENKHHGKYTYFVGEEITEESGNDYILNIPSQKYIRFTLKGEPAQVVPIAWQEIWQMSSEDLGGKRSYIADFEVYYGEGKDIEIYIGIK